MLSVVNIDELLQTALKADTNSENAHQWLDQNGWENGNNDAGNGNNGGTPPNEPPETANETPEEPPEEPLDRLRIELARAKAEAENRKIGYGCFFRLLINSAAP